MGGWLGAELIEAAGREGGRQTTGSRCPACLWGGGGVVHGQGGEVVVRLAGLAVGDGLTDPAVQVLTKPAAAYAFGLLDGKQVGGREGGRELV